MKEQRKKPEKKTNETDLNNLSDKEFKTLVIRIDEHSENFNKKLENIKKSEMKNTITEMKNL